MAGKGAAIHLIAVCDLIEAAIVHVACELGILVDGVIVGLDAICVVDGKLWVERRLDVLVDDAVTDAERVHGEKVAR